MFPGSRADVAGQGAQLLGTVEVETAESVNHLEAMAQWAHFGRARAPFHLYVPAGSVDIARRLAAENQVNVAEIWSYHTIGDQTRFTLVHRAAPGTESRKPADEPKRTSEPATTRAVKPKAAAKANPKPSRPKGRPSRSQKKSAKGKTQKRR